MKKFIITYMILVAILIISTDMISLANDSEHGNAGRLSIADTGIAVPVSVPDAKHDAQDVTDSSHACYLDYGVTPMIVDHRAQDFKTLKKVKPGYEACYDDGEQMKMYVCEAIIKGDRIIDKGYELPDGTYVHDCGADLAMITCRDSTGRHVWITLWKLK